MEGEKREKENFGCSWTNFDQMDDVKKTKEKQYFLSCVYTEVHV